MHPQEHPPGKSVQSLLVMSLPTPAVDSLFQLQPLGTSWSDRSALWQSDLEVKVLQPAPLHAVPTAPIAYEVVVAPLM